MAQALSTLALGAKLEIQVKSEWQYKFGARITYIVVDKNHAGYPSGAISLMTEKALFTSAYDAKEPTNPSTDRRDRGNSRYIHSNIHQWLNSNAESWYTAKHTYDAPPIAENIVNGVNPYASWPGFLNMLNEQFVLSLMTTSLVARRADIDGGGTDSLSDKMFLPSLPEMGYSSQTDGTILAYFNNNERRAYAIPEAGVSGYVNTYTRSAGNSSEYVWALDKNWNPGDEYSGNFAYGFSYFRPMCNLPGAIMVMPSPYTTGAFILVENPPTAPTINYPVSGEKSYNKRPRVLITLNAASASGLTQTLISAGYTPAKATGQNGQKIRLQKTSDATVGNNTISVQTQTQYSNPSTAASRGYTYEAPTFTDNPIQQNTTRIKAAHMNELRTMINNIRGYYGLAAVAWAEPIVANTTSTRNWAAHITEMRQAIQDVVTLVNNWDTSTTALRIVMPAWLPIETGKPQASVMEQLRAVIQIL